jgi:pantoate--beta-alanine ligase
MIVTRTVDETRRARAGMGKVAFVPTMGALHEGHLSLIRRARELADHVAVSIFVNPTQFAPHEDLEQYPRPIEQDLRRCEELGVELVFNPGVAEMYPPNELAVSVEAPDLGRILEGEHRPHFFGGVCRVVAKLFNIVAPEVAVFGMKDFQQLRIVETMARGLKMPVEIIGEPTVREADGLAMSSRNVYLRPEQRRRALAISRSLEIARSSIEGGELNPEAIEPMMRHELEAHGLGVDYATVRDAWTLAPIEVIEPQRQPVVCLIAARVGGVRLIDNAPIGLDAPRGAAGRGQRPDTLED